MLTTLEMAVAETIRLLAIPVASLINLRMAWDTQVSILTAITAASKSNHRQVHRVMPLPFTIKATVRGEIHMS